MAAEPFLPSVPLFLRPFCCSPLWPSVLSGGLPGWRQPTRFPVASRKAAIIGSHRPFSLGVWIPPEASLCTHTFSFASSPLLPFPPLSSPLLFDSPPSVPLMGFGPCLSFSLPAPVSPLPICPHIPFPLLASTLHGPAARLQGPRVSSPARALGDFHRPFFFPIAAPPPPVPHPPGLTGWLSPLCSQPAPGAAITFQLRYLLSGRVPLAHPPAPSPSFSRGPR
jgi:hypothetical protein